MTVWLDYAARGRNALWRYIVATPLALVIATGLGALLVLALLFSGLATPQGIAAINDPSRPAPFFAGVFASFGLVLIGFVAALWLVHRKRFRDVLGRWRWGAVAIGAVGWGFAQIVATGADAAVSPHALRISATSASVILALVATPALAVQTFAEEFIFRGYITQGLFLALRRPLPCSVLSGVIFAAVHIPNGAPQALGALMFGTVIAYAAIRTGSLAFGFGVHLANNLFGSLVVVSDADVFKGAPALVTEHAPGLLWWDAGVEAVLLACLALLVARLAPPAPVGLAATTPASRSA